MVSASSVVFTPVLSGTRRENADMLPRFLHLRPVIRVAALLLALVGFALPVHAQSDGVIQGTIQDAQSAVLPGVALTLRNTDTGVVRENQVPSPISPSLP